MTQLSNILDLAQTNKPNEMRLVWRQIEPDGSCSLEVFPCPNMGEVEIAENGADTYFWCTDLATGSREAVAVTAGESDGTTTFTISRYLPRNGLDRLLQAYRRQCGITMYLLQGEACSFPNDPQAELDIVWLLGEPRFPDSFNYSAFGVRDDRQATPIEGTLTVQASQFTQVGIKNLSNLTDNGASPIVAVTECEQASCVSCPDCREWAWVNSTGFVGYTTDLLTSTTYINVLPNLGVFVPTDIYAVGGKVYVTGADTAGNVGKIWVTNDEDLKDGTPAPTWAEYLTDSTATNLLELRKMFHNGTTLWIVGDGGSAYRLNTITNAITAVSLGVTEDLNDVHFRGRFGIIGGNNGTVLRSIDRGTSWSTLVVADPAGGNLTDDVLAVTNGENGVNSWGVGTDTGRIIVTENEGANYFSQEIPNTTATATIDALEISGAGIGHMALNDGGAGSAYMSVYGLCGRWTQLPENGTIPANTAINDVAVCNRDVNTALWVGANDAGTAGQLFLGRVAYV